MRPKLAVYKLAKASGLFELARAATSDQLRILCYHGVELCDESRFMPGVFMRRETFAQRLGALKGYPVLPLGEAVQRLKDGTLPPCATAITIDDGFHSTAAVAAPMLHAANLPATLYVTTYYTNRETPVFRLALQYVFWKAGCAHEQERLWELINRGELTLDEPARFELLMHTAAELRVDLQPVLQARAFHLMTADELDATTLDLQLHTHRHRIPVDPLRARREVEDNRRALGKHAKSPLVHFCYPSGFYAEKLFATMSAAGVETATTCENGLNDRDANPLALRRFLDGEAISELEFEAELSGFAHLLRLALKRNQRVVPITAADEERGYPAGPGRSAA